MPSIPERRPAEPCAAPADAARGDAVGDSPVDYRALVEHMRAAVFIDQHCRIRYANPKLTELFGGSGADLLDDVDFADLTVPEDRELLLEHRRRHAAGAPGHAYDVRLRRRDGSTFTGRIHGTLIHFRGQPAHLVTVLDVSELKQAACDAERRSALLAQAEELALIGSSEHDVASGLVTQSAGMFRIFGEVPVGGPLDGEWLMRRVPAVEEAVVRAVLRGVKPGEPREFEHRIVRVDGKLRTVVHRALAECDAHGRTTRIVGILQDITAQRTAERQLSLLARRDEVTALPNRAALLHALDLGLRQAHRDGQELALLVLQIDQLKLVSDSFGYASGDRLLADVGQRLAAVRAQDLFAHLGNGEYAALLGPGDGSSKAAALAAARALIAALTPPFVVDGTEVVVTCAVGLTRFPSDGDSADRLLHQAQAARHRVRDQGDDRVGVYTPESHARAGTRLALEAALRHALERGEFQLRYQPQLDLTSGAVVGVEALLRWDDPLRGTVSPLEFVPLAEETGLIVPIGEWVLRTACAQNLVWQRAGLPAVRMAVNLSVRQLQQPDIARRIHSILVETGLQPRFLGLEITESVLVGNSAHAVRVLAELRALGIEISLDDFGTGYSNLSNLRTLPIDVLKVDRSLVHDVTAAPQDVSLTRAVITMAHSLQMKVLAEGVETEGQLALLIANHCDQMQGFFFSEPVAADAVAGLLRERRQLPAHLLQRRGHPRTLLIVDDEPNVASSLKRLLRRDGYAIVTADSGAQGLLRLAEQPVDVIVSDQRMPGMTGVEFLRRAKALYPDTVRMVLSGYTELQSITDAVNEGAIYKFLTKPWDDERLRGHIEEAFRQKELADENRRLGRAVQSANQELAEVNRRLQTLLESQRERINLEERSLAVTRRLLQAVPTPLIGIDDDGMIAFASGDAEALFAGPATGCAGLLGQDVGEALPAAMQRVWHDGDGALHRVELHGRAFHAVCRPIDEAVPSGGKLLVLIPGPPAADASPRGPRAASFAGRGGDRRAEAAPEGASEGTPEDEFSAHELDP